MSHDTLTPAELRHPDSIKWQHYGPDVLPMWIADMDFPVAPPILDALHKRLESPIGYGLDTDPALIALLQTKLATYGLENVPAEGFKLLPGVVPGLYAGVFALTAPGDSVVTMTPIYHPFHMAINDLGRKALNVPLIDSSANGGAGRWEIDWDALDAACAQTRLLMLCHPHNPTGRVWDAEELGKLRELVIKHDLYVISDELHAELRYTGQPFESFAADPRMRPRTLTLTGPCKAFNTAGLGIGAMVCYDTELLGRVKASFAGLMGHPSVLSVTMWKAALTEGGPWLAQTVDYLRGNRDYLYSFMQERLPWVKFHVVEATYLAWLDLRPHARSGDIQKFLLDEAKVAIHNGPLFASGDEKAQYQGFVRVNFAMPRALLTEALEQLAAALTHSTDCA